MFSIDFSKKISIPEHILYKDLNGEAVILNLNSEAYFGLDEVGNRMFNLLSTSDCIQTAYNMLLDEYDVSADILRQDIQLFIEKLVEQGTIHVVD